MRDQIAKVHAALTAKLLWSAAEVSKVFATSDDIDDVALHVDLLVDIALELAPAENLHVVGTAPGAAYTETDVQRVVERIGDAGAGRRRRYLESHVVRATRLAALDVVASLIGVTDSIGWWQHRLAEHALDDAAA